MDENVTEFVGWLQGRGQDFPAFSDKLIDETAKSVEQGYDTAKSKVLSHKDLDNREMLGMTAILQKLQDLKVDPQKGSYLVRRIDSISRAGTDCDECMGNLR